MACLAAYLLFVPTKAEAAFVGNWSDFASLTDFNTNTGLQLTCSTADEADGYATFCEIGGACGNWRSLNGSLGPAWCDPGPSGSFSASSFTFTAATIDTEYSFIKCSTDPGAGSYCPDTEPFETQFDFCIGDCGSSSTTSPTSTPAESTEEDRALLLMAFILLFVGSFMAAYKLTRIFV